MATLVIILYSREDDAHLALLADAIKQFGYDVWHTGLTNVGDIEIDELSNRIALDGPVVICGTVRAAGSKWLRQLVARVRASNPLGFRRLFPVRLEQDANLEALGFGVTIAECSLNFTTGIDELKKSLDKYFPLTNTETLASVATHSPFKPSAELTARIDALSAELTSHPLLGRSNELDQLGQFLDRTGGFMLVTGDAGYGKSALLAHWLNRQPAQRRVVRHLFSYRSDLTRSVLEFYRSTLITLSVYWSLPLLRLPASELEARDALFELFENVRISEISKRLPLVLVVDGLDEAAPTERWDCPFLPKVLPEGLHIIISVRLGDEDLVPAHLREWVAQSDERLLVGLLDRKAVKEWMCGLGGLAVLLADDESAVDAVLQKTLGLPLYLAFMFGDLSELLPSREAFTKAIEQMPMGFAAYVDMQFCRLVESPVGREQRWREFFGLLVAAKGELDREDISDILDLTIWELHTLPAELYRWVAQRVGGYAFRNEALRLAFDRLDPWPNARERLLHYCRDWARHHRPYAFRSLIGHLRDADDWPAWVATATDQEFLRYQGEAFPYEPLMPLQTIEESMAEAIARKDFQSLSRLAFVHATWIPDPHIINPTKWALTAPALAWQQIKLAETTDPSTEVMWQVLVAWRCAVAGKLEEAKQFLSQVAITGRRVSVVYWGQILGVILPQLMAVEPDLSLKIALAFLDTAELPRFLGTALPVGDAIVLTQNWYQERKPKSLTGWFALWRSLAERDEMHAILEATRNLESEDHRANALLQVAVTLNRLERLERLEECLEEIELHPAKLAASADILAKTRLVTLAFIGSLRLKGGNPDGRRLLLEAEDAAKALPLPVQHRAEAIALVATAWAQIGETEMAGNAFRAGIELVQTSGVADIVRTGALQEIALPLWASHRSSPRLRDCVLDLLCALTELTSIPLRLQTKNNLLRTIADGWDELRDSEQASEWLRKIPNPQFRGKALGDFVSRRLTDSNLEGATEAHTLVKTYGGRHPGWGMVRLGVFHLRHEQWDDAADAFASAVQSGATQVGNLNSQTAVLLAELALAFDLLDQPELAQQHLLAAVRRARHTPGSYNWWSLLNVAERTYWVRSSDLGAIALEEATLGALQAKDDPQRIPLLCFLARVQHIVARQPERAQQALQAAMDIIRRHVPDQVKRTTLRCEIAEALHLCGLDEQAREELSHIAHFAQQRASHPYNGDEIVAEAALGHARVVEIEGAKRLLNLVRDRRFDSVARAWAIIHTYEGDDDASEAEVCKVANENRRARIRRDLATILVRLGRVRQALVVTRRIQADRDNAFPRVAMTMVENGFRDAFFELIIPATRFPNATGLILGCLLRLHPEIASNVSSSLVQYVPDILTESSST